MLGAALPRLRHFDRKRFLNVVVRRQSGRTAWIVGATLSGVNSEFAPACIKTSEGLQGLYQMPRTVARSIRPSVVKQFAGGASRRERRRRVSPE
jgi:hypothetical protein